MKNFCKTIKLIMNIDKIIIWCIISHFWDRPVPIFSDVRFSYPALVQDKKITCVLPANACCTVYVNYPSNYPCFSFLAHLTQGSGELLSPLSVCRLSSSSVRPLTFHILINSSEATGPIWTKLWWNGPWMAPFQICVRWSRLPTKMAAKLKIEKRGDEILIVHCCFSVSQNELKF
jgi:hypothetical protein